MTLSSVLATLARLEPSSFLGRTLRIPLKIIPQGSVVKVRSGMNRGAKWLVRTSDHGCWLGHYELAKQTALLRYLRAGMNVMDIGANAGFYTLGFSRAVGASGQVWAFEPFASNVESLLGHVLLNKLTNTVVVQAAVSNRVGTSGFLRHASNAMGRLADSSEYLVPTVTVDILRREHSIPVPDLIKIDVEGGEAAVLNGAFDTLSLKRTIVFLALHGPTPERDCLEIFQKLGYELEYLDGNPATQRPLLRDEVVAIPRMR